MEITATDDNVHPREITRLVTSAEVLGQLVGQFAHDLNNQLAVVLAGVELAARVGDLAKARQLLVGVMEAIERQRVLLEAMADASAACAQPQRVDLHALLDSARAVLEARLGTRRLVLIPDAGDAVVRCDPAFLLDAFAHIVAQAREGGFDGDVTIETSNGPATRHDRGGDRYLILTAGPLFGQTTADLDIDRAFELFSMVDRNGGLGLAQIHDTARRAGGLTTLEHLPQGGLALRLALPLARVDAH